MASGNKTRAPNAWPVLAILSFGNLFNFFDRAIPAVLVEPIRAEWDLDDLHIGFIPVALAGTAVAIFMAARAQRRDFGWTAQ